MKFINLITILLPATQAAVGDACVADGDCTAFECCGDIFLEDPAPATPEDQWINQNSPVCNNKHDVIYFDDYANTNGPTEYRFECLAT